MILSIVMEVCTASGTLVLKVRWHISELTTHERRRLVDRNCNDILSYGHVHHVVDTTVGKATVSW